MSVALVESVVAPDEVVPSCAHLFMKSKCSCGKEYIKPIVCGHEWCPTCGQEGSATHKQTFSRWWENESETAGLSHMAKAGYWVFTVPEEERQGFLDPARLRAATTYVHDLMKSLGYAYGRSRWHWASEAQPDKWHPHLNVVIEAGKLSETEMESVKIAWAAFFGRTDWRKINCHYKYIDPDVIGTVSYEDLVAVGYLPGGKITKELQKKAWREVCLRRMIHLAKYITRPTWATGGSAQLQKAMRDTIRGYRNSCWWGPKKWPKEAVWELKDGEDAVMHSLVKGRCTCGRPVKWVRCTPEENRILRFRAGELIPVGGGFFEIPPWGRFTEKSVLDLIYGKKDNLA